jgi:hypothetical protein
MITFHTPLIVAKAGSGNRYLTAAPFLVEHRSEKAKEESPD